VGLINKKLTVEHWVEDPTKFPMLSSHVKPAFVNGEVFREPTARFTDFAALIASPQTSGGCRHWWGVGGDERKWEVRARRELTKTRGKHAVSLIRSIGNFVSEDLAPAFLAPRLPHTSPSSRLAFLLTTPVVNDCAISLFTTRGT
jgi:hypothetical protein